MIRLGASVSRRFRIISSALNPDLQLIEKAPIRLFHVANKPRGKTRIPQRTLAMASRPLFAQETKDKPPKRRRIVMRKPPVKLTDTARNFFQKLLKNPPRENVIGIMLDYHQSTSGEPRMVYSFRFVSAQDIDENLDESVSLWEADDTEHKHNDDKFKLYVHHNAFLKVLGATLDVNVEKVTPILYDREGNLMDPNA